MYTKEAIEYYKESLNAKVVFLQTFGEGPIDNFFGATLWQVASCKQKCMANPGYDCNTL